MGHRIGDIQEEGASFFRPEEDPPCGDSGNEVVYEMYTITHEGGLLALDLHADSSSNFSPFQNYGNLSDPFLILYSQSFNPASPCTNFVHGNDDGGINDDSVMFFADLPAGTYVAVVTYYGFPDGGTYEFSYTSFPEPQSGPIPTVGEWGIIILSMLLAGSSLWIRRRRIRHS